MALSQPDSDRSEWFKNEFCRPRSS